MEMSRMWPTKVRVDQFHWANFSRIAAVAVLLTMYSPIRSMAQQHGQKTFSSAEDASHALVTAAESNDEKTMLEILGPDGKSIVSSGDDAEDSESRTKFVKKYQEMHRLVKEPDGTTILYIGAENWPTPIPLMNKRNSWYFDTDAGKKEILYRRIGRNEIWTIRVVQLLVGAQKEYSSAHGEYTQRILSDDGKQDGFFWKSGGCEPQSLETPLVAAVFTATDAQ